MGWISLFIPLFLSLRLSFFIHSFHLSLLSSSHPLPFNLSRSLSLFLLPSHSLFLSLSLHFLIFSSLPHPFSFCLPLSLSIHSSSFHSPFSPLFISPYPSFSISPSHHCISPILSLSSLLLSLLWLTFSSPIPSSLSPFGPVSLHPCSLLFPHSSLSIWSPSRAPPLFLSIFSLLSLSASSHLHTSSFIFPPHWPPFSLPSLSPFIAPFSSYPILHLPPLFLPLVPSLFIVPLTALCFFLFPLFLCPFLNPSHSLSLILFLSRSLPFPIFYNINQYLLFLALCYSVLYIYLNLPIFISLFFLHSFLSISSSLFLSFSLAWLSLFSAPLFCPFSHPPFFLTTPFLSTLLLPLLFWPSLSTLLSTDLSLDPWLTFFLLLSFSMYLILTLLLSLLYLSILFLLSLPLYHPPAHSTSPSIPLFFSCHPFGPLPPHPPMSSFSPSLSFTPVCSLPSCYLF